MKIMILKMKRQKFVGFILEKYRLVSRSVLLPT